MLIAVFEKPGTLLACIIRQSRRSKAPTPGGSKLRNMSKASLTSFGAFFKSFSFCKTESMAFTKGLLSIFGPLISFNSFSSRKNPLSPTQPIKYTRHS